MSRLIIFIFAILTSEVFGQANNQISSSDSILIKNRIENFYFWYAQQIINHLDEFSPTFSKKSDGMTTLDFKKYRNGLETHGFSTDFINRKIKSYQPCVVNLSKVKYESYLEFDGLDQYEEIKCDFDNVREWTMEQEPHDGADLVRLDRINKRTIIATVQFYNINTDGKKYIWDYKQGIVTFVKQGNDWKIDNLQIERL